MNSKEEMLWHDDVQNYRDLYICELDKEDNKTAYVRNNADSLYALGLTMYSKNYSFESLVYNAFAMSELDENIALHPEQRKVLDLINSNRGIVFSAPTSFGKTFIVFEYICKMRPNNIVMIVPTLALIDEYKQKIIRTYKDAFKEYNIYLTIDIEKKYDFNKKNIFILTHDRVLDENVVRIFKKIDFLVIDEVYKLQKNESDDRVLILNIAYYNMVKLSEKYVLLAPFISGIENLDKLDHTPYFYSTNFSPVVNKVEVRDIIDEKDRVSCTNEVLSNIPMSEQTLIYFPTVKEIDSYIENTDIQYDNIDIEINPLLSEFLEWGRKEIHPKWSVIKALEKGFLVHHGQLPLGIRMIELELFNSDNSIYTRLICTSTLLEGVNTTAKNIIITKPSRVYKKNFDAFDFYNLVGRTGRLYQHYLGIAYYIKAPNDPAYYPQQALKSIEFELTDSNIDMDINFGEYFKHDNFMELLKKLNITYEDYKENIARKFRFATVEYIYKKYCDFKPSLIDTLTQMSVNKEKSKLDLIRVLYNIIEKQNYNFKINTFILNRLTYKNRQSVRKVVDITAETFKSSDISTIINTTIRYKSSFIEFEFYRKIDLIRYFMRCDSIDDLLINTLHDKLMKNIELIYYINQSSKKMLKDMGIYDGDIDQIIKIIGTDFTSVSELQKLLKIHNSKFKSLGIVSKYIINRLI